MGYEGLEACGEGHELTVTAVWWEQTAGDQEEHEEF